MITPGSMRDVQIWQAERRSGGSSNDPPLTLTLPVAPVPSCQTREPQAGQNAQASVPPLPFARDQTFTSPCVRRKSARLTMTEMPKADEDCFWHSRQWQTYSASGSPRIS
jgi:hypothetical protein